MPPPSLNMLPFRPYLAAPVPGGRVATTSLFAAVPEAQLTAGQVEIKQVQEKWNAIRLMSREEAQGKLEGEWLEAYNRFYGKYDEDMARMEEIVEKLQKSIDPPKLEKKSKSQKKRDAYARKVARGSPV